MSDYSKGLEINPEKAILYHLRALLYKKRNNLEKAILDLKEYAKRKPTHPKRKELQLEIERLTERLSGSQESDYWYQQGVEHGHNKEWKEAASCLRRAFDELKKARPELKINPPRGSLEKDTGSDRKSSAQADDFWYQQGDLCQKKKRWAMAALYFREAIETGRNPLYGKTPETQGALYWYREGLILQNEKRWEEAEKCFRKAIPDGSEFVDAYSSLAFGYGKLGKNQEAVTYYSKAIGIEPQNADLYFWRAIIRGKMGKSAEAMSDFSIVVELDPTNFTAWMKRGYILKAKQDWSAAILNFTEALKLGPDSSPLYLERGFAYQKIQKYENAIEDFETYLNMNPKSPRTNQLQSDIEEMKKKLSKSPK
ncbi:MAG: tetratricopeptide repeat protein, partial [Planctomycetota bacterium]|jgi:tetratricopeptide (TPR) repeat protein|nr:tetratricopeptide repeat protein [Planctomycetota bacterium]